MTRKMKWLYFSTLLMRWSAYFSRDVILRLNGQAAGAVKTEDKNE